MNGFFKQTNLRGGVHFCDSIEEVDEYAKKMCGKHMTTSTMMDKDHMERGWLCNSVLVYEKLEVLKEFFISIDYDRNIQKPVITYSSRGGMTLPMIEKRYPETIHKIYIDIMKGLDLNVLLKVADNLGIHEK